MRVSRGQPQSLPELGAAQTGAPRPAKHHEVRAPATPVLGGPAPVGSPQVRELERALARLAPKAGEVHLLGPAAVEAKLQELSAKGLAVTRIGTSQEGRPISAIRVGDGPVHLAAIAGAHPDEPVGTSTALHLAERLATDPELAPLRHQITLDLVPMANPDGSARNEAWFQSWEDGPDVGEYLRLVQRDLPANDVEFGFPGMPDDRVRPENAALAAWIDGLGKLDHYVSLHSMFLGGGALGLVLTDDLAAASPRIRFLLGQLEALGMPLHDQDRFGQKGFFRIGPGLQTAPTSEAMSAFFAKSDGKIAKSFLLNSMQYAQAKADCPVAMVTEIPLCFDPELSSREIVPGTRAEAEAGLAEKLSALHDEVRQKLAALSQVADREGVDPSRLSRFDARMDNGKAAALALKNDLARYGDEPARVGELRGHQLQLLRRRAALYSEAAEVAGSGSGAFAKTLQAELLRERDDALMRIEDEFDLRHPSLEGQVQAQIGAVLAGLLPLHRGVDGEHDAQ